jgi:hypothetical protein
VSAKAAGGGTSMHFRVGTKGASGMHVGYITRERAVLDREAGLHFHNMPEQVRKARDYAELRGNLEAHATAREDAELAAHRSRGEPRTHYRAMLSFERDVSTGKALGMAGEWMQREFPQGRGFAVVHRDTEHMHVHVWLDARQVNGRKVQLSERQFKNLDSAWNRIYSREMGRDPHEYELKKEQTREAKRQHWQQKQRPEYPPRTRATAEQLAPRYERREIGAAAAREGGDRPGGTFLEQVRQVAGRDFKEAQSWGELERRLERHGLRVETKGAGLVVTDGRQHVKASSVDRGASRAKLEQRFGGSLAASRAEREAFGRASPEVREVVCDLHTLERGQWTGQDHGQATRHAGEAGARRDQLRWNVERAQQASRDFDKALGDVYRDPARAREGFEAFARGRGAESAAEEMRQRPEQFGQLRTQEQRRAWGLIRSQDTTAARVHAVGAAQQGEKALQARAQAPHPADLARADFTVRRAEVRRQELGRAVQGFDATRTRAQIGLGANRLNSSEVGELHRWTTPKQQQLTAKLREAVQRLMPAQVRELAQWVTAPHRALAGHLIQGFKGLIHDHGREPGSE